MFEPPLISVTVPVFNGEEYLLEALESLHAQNYPNLEIIVIDDGSTDGTAEIIQSQGEKIRSLRQANRGPAAAVNSGIRLSRGRILAFLDSDDRWSPTMLASSLPVLTRAGDCEIVTGLTQRYERDRAFGAPHQGLYFGASLFRREIFDRVGLLDEALTFSEDADWFLRAMEAGVRVQFFRETTLHYRQHGKNLTCDQQATFQGYAFALKRSLDRRRRSGSEISIG